jgi:hypothetical protein
LCGEDRATGQSYEHRREWIEQRASQLSSVFAIDVASYAVMSNHYHLVVRIDAERADSWSDQEVLQRWTQIFSGPLFVRRYLNAKEREKLSDSEINQVNNWVAIYRQRLRDLSWYMRVLNETIARKANAEDQCTGRFWEGRFKSQALLDNQAVLLAMSYVDLNPVRANIAKTPEESKHTAIHKRLHDLKAEHPDSKPKKPAFVENSLGKPAVKPPLSIRGEASINQLPQAPLLPFEPTATLPASIPFSLDDYLALVDTLGRAIHPHKQGKIPEDIPEILVRMGLNAEMLLDSADRLLKSFAFAIGAPKKLSDLASRRQNRYLRKNTGHALYD